MKRGLLLLVAVGLMAVSGQAQSLKDLLNSQVVKDVAELGVLVMKSMIRYTVKVKEARSAHKALRDYAPGGTATQDYADLADEVLDVLGLDVSNVDTQKDGVQ